MSDRKIADYKLFSPQGSYSDEEFSIMVKKEIENGWIPLGSPSFLAFSYKFIFSKFLFVRYGKTVCQAMVKYGDEEV